jgi:hypothetical protein
MTRLEAELEYLWRFYGDFGAQADPVIASNAALQFHEMRLSGLPALTRPVYCTMKGYRALELRRQRLSEHGLPPHQARSGWRSARRDRGRMARDADLSLAARLPASASIAPLASSHSIQLPSPHDPPIP